MRGRFSLAEGCDADANPARRVDNAALIALDPQTGALLALVGSPDYFDPTINGALTWCWRSAARLGDQVADLRRRARSRTPGSRRGAVHRRNDHPRPARPRSSPPRAALRPQQLDRRYHGPVTVRTALANSYNIPAVRTLDAIGVDALIEQAERLGFRGPRG